MKVVIDRIEEDMAVVELPDKTTVSIPVKIFENAIEGAVYEIMLKSGETEKKQIEKLMDSVWED